MDWHRWAMREYAKRTRRQSYKWAICSYGMGVINCRTSTIGIIPVKLALPRKPGTGAAMMGGTL